MFRMTLRKCLGRSRALPGALSAEEGFSIIEVLAAFTVLAIVTLGTVPLFISGLRASLVSRLDTAGKNLSQERFEAMRNLPFYVGSSLAAPAASCTTPGVITPGCDYKDLLDTYYRSAQPALSTTVGGYVPAGGARSADEIDAGVIAPFYRYVESPVPNFQNGKFSIVVATQFLDVTSANPRANPLTPPADYNTQDSDTDFPKSRFVGITVINRWTAGALTKKFASFSQISEGPPDTTLVVLQAQATALRLRTALSATELLNMDVGVSNSDGLFSNGASAATGTRGAFASIVPGSAIDGANAIASAPPVSTSGTGLVPAQSLNYATYVGYPAASFANSNIDDVTAAIISDQPSVPSVNPGTDLSLGELLRQGAGGNDLTFTNRVLGTPSGPPDLSLSLSDPYMVLSKASGGGRAGAGSTYIKSAAGASHFVESGARAEMQTVRILPTQFALDGVVQVQLVSASLVCKTTGSSSAGTTASFEVHVRHITPTGSYATYRFTQAGALDGPLPNLATTLVAPVPPFFLSGWVREWSVLPGASTVISSPPKSVNSTLNGIFSMTTANTRAGDDRSAIGLTVGHLSCVAEDFR